LQLIAPFIHAHAFGIETAQAHTNHAHAVEDVFHNHAPSSNFNLHIADVNQQDSIEMPQAIGSIFKVANGVKRNLLIDIDMLLLPCVLVFGLFVRVSQSRVRTFDFLFHQQLFYSPHSPRAPPR
jgi:hypothetical protein